MAKAAAIGILAAALTLLSGTGAASEASTSLPSTNKLTHTLLDFLTGVPTAVTVSEYGGEDPWQGEDLIACPNQAPKRFGDATPEEQAQALSGVRSGETCQFLEGEPFGFGYRATSGDDHVHADFDKPYGQAPDGTLGVIEKEPTRLEIGLDFAHNNRYYQSDLWTGLGPNGELLTWRDVTYYSQDHESGVFESAGCMTGLSPIGQPSDQCRGLRTQFHLAIPSPNSFLPLKATLDCSAEDGSCNLNILVSAQVAGDKLFAHIVVKGGAEPSLDAVSIPLGPACPPKVMAFYYPWYGGAPGYRHWATATDDPRFAHDPNQIVDSGPQYPEGDRRDIASGDYPVLAPYDSQAQALIDQHLAWANEAGIDTLISSWWGPGTYEDASLDLLLDRIEATSSPVRASVYLETWAMFYGHQFQPDFFSDPRNFAPDSREQIRQKAADRISYLLTTYGDRPSFARTTKGAAEEPIIFVYSAALFQPEEWQDIFARVRAQTGRDAFYQGDVEGADFQAQARAFDGLHVYTPVHLTTEGQLSFVARLLDPEATVRNPASTATDAATIGADYQIWAAEARANGRSWAATVIPGFDDRQVRSPSFFVSRDRGEERTYDFFWSMALSSRPDWVVITSFNEWHEGTEIEPSVEYGAEFLGRTRSWANRIEMCGE